jgi:iron complex transport system permease protein
VSSTLTIRLAGDRVSLRTRRRPLAVALILVLVALAAAVASIATGDYPLSIGQVIAALLGNGDPGSAFIVETLRLPRALTALLVGASLGVAGAIFQSIARNALGSPDVIGFTYGAATGALVVILIHDGSAGQVALGAIGGGLLTAVAVYLLAYRGGVQGYRLVLVGIGVGSMLLAANSYLITRARRDDAMEAAHWLVGSLNGRGWEHVVPVAAALALLLPAAFLLARRLDLLEMGDDAAKALGVDVERSRLQLALVGVGLTSVAVASTGPIAFVALTAPQIARRLGRISSPGLGTSALMGAVILVVSDLLAQRVLPRDLPVGIVTGLVGGVYLAWLLSNEWRTR